MKKKEQPQKSNHCKNHQEKPMLITLDETHADNHQEKPTAGTTKKPPPISLTTTPILKPITPILLTTMPPHRLANSLPMAANPTRQF